MTEQPDKTNIQTASRRQIVAAIEHIRKSGLEPAITLGLAAEGMLPTTEKEHLFPKVKELGKALAGKEEEGATGPNDVGNWLKHGTYDGKPCETATITELEGLVAVQRAISKYAACYGGISKEMVDFTQWALERLLPKPAKPK
jgi:hypothetical protein